ELFVQGERSIDRTQGGLGIGLTLVRTLTELHGGSVHASSAGPGQGSEFVVRLPAAAALAKPDDRVAPPSALGTRSPIELRVLVVDDNEDGAQTVAAALRALGYQVAVAHDGPTALTAADRFAPDAVVLDIGLPVMNGYEVARQLRKGERTHAAKLIALTGYGQEVDRANSRVAGFDVHLVKPVDLAALDAALSPTKS